MMEVFRHCKGVPNTWANRLAMMAAYLVLFNPILESVNAESLVFPPYGHSYGIRKATPQHLFMFFGPRTFFDNPQGLATTRLDAWEDPTTKKDDDEVVVYGVNSDRHQIIFNSSMWTLGIYGRKGSEKDCFLYPKGVAADRHGNVFVADSGNNRVVKLKNPKSSLEWVKAFNGASTTDHGIKGPARIAVDEDCRVYVTDTQNHRIFIFNTDGKTLKIIPCIAVPTALAIADGKSFWSFFREERVIFYADGQKDIIKTDLQGNQLAKNSLPQGYSASYGAVDYYHNYWITDTEKHVIIKYDHDLNLLDIFGSFGTGDHQFVEPRGITIYKRYGQVFIAEKKGAQYYWIGSDIKKISLYRQPLKEYYTLTVSTTEYSFLSLFSIINGDTCFYLRRHRIPAGDGTLTIDNEEHDPAQNKVMARIEPTYSSYTYFSWMFPVSIQK